MALNRDDIKEVRQRKYLARDFDSIRGLLLEYARLYYPNTLRDFSEQSLGGLLLDFAAYTGDVMSFYMDHQFRELNPETAVEPINIQRALRASGVPIVGAAPAIVPVTAFVEIPAVEVNNVLGPQEDAIPIIQENSTFISDGGTTFNLLEDINFNATRSDGTLIAELRVGKKTPTGVPLTFIMAHTGLCISGEEASETTTIGQAFVPFRRLRLSNPNVSDIINVNDGLGNIYYKVGSLTHDVVYRNVLNTAKDNDIVKDSLKIIPAPYRFTEETDINNRLTTLVFGGGSAQTLEDDVVPDPSDFAIAFPYTKTFSRIPVNPNQLLTTNTLGIAAAGTTVNIVYRHGGGLDHNVEPGAIQTPGIINMFFPGNPSPGTAAQIRGSLEVTNRIRASGGEDAPSADDLKTLIPAIKNSQERIVTREDLLARVYTLPSNFGRVFRAAIRSNSNNPLATQLFIVSRDENSNLITAPDTLKQNLIKFLNPYRMIADAIDIMDARIVNLTLKFEILVDPALNRATVLQSILTRMQSLFDIKNFNIDQPIIVSDVVNNIFTVPGILSVGSVRFDAVTGVVNNREYSDTTYDVAANTRQGIIFPPGGGIFEIRYPEVDIVGRAVV
jgi:hypothetical protein